MQYLPEAYAALAAYDQFILWTAVTRHDKRIDKLPMDWRSGKLANAYDSTIWTDLKTILKAAKSCGSLYNLGWVLTKNDPFYFVDLDNCLTSSDAWSPVAIDIMAKLPGAAVEVSTSGQGLHIIGQGVVPDHCCKNESLGIEFYTDKRFLTLTGTNIIGSADTINTATLPDFINTYFTPKITVHNNTWSHEPVKNWNGYTDNNELINKAILATSVASAFGDTASFKNLWEGDKAVLAHHYPDVKGIKPYNASSADAALAQHLAFWTGCHHERIFIIMWLSKLVRKKWSRNDYLILTITNACAMQSVVYTAGGDQNEPIIKLTGSIKAKKYANSIINQKLLQCTDDQHNQLLSLKGPALTASFWIDNKDKSLDELFNIMTPIDKAIPPTNNDDDEPKILTGYQYLGVTQQIDFFKGCAYIADIHRVLTPNGSLYKVDQFNAVYSGYDFQIDADGVGKTTKKAWDAFVESHAIRFSKVDSVCFKPQKSFGEIITKDGRRLINTYMPIATPRKKGDASLFINHLIKLLPNDQDRQILLAYMAACIQYKGIKFQWAPVIQGTDGNGKTLITECVAFALGDRYVHMPRADEISEKYNGWLFNKLLIGIEDVFIKINKTELIEILKPMITGRRLAKREMQMDWVMDDPCANFILNMNYKDGLKKTKNDRRLAIFYTSQQNKNDIIKDGLGGDYFKKLYQWLKLEGYAIVADYLASYPIPDKLNPAHYNIAPVTSSTEEAIGASLGWIEQEIAEAIDEGRVGFRGGWVSSMAVDQLIQGINASYKIPPNKRRELLMSLGYDWHPALPRGRTNNPIVIDNGKKPRLYIKSGHIHANLNNPADVSRHYQEAQGVITSQHDTTQCNS